MVVADLLPVLLSLPFEVVGVGIFLRRMAPRLRAIDWRGRPGDALPALSAAALVLNIGFLAFLIIRYEGDLDAAPERLILTLDHIMFIGVLTNALFGQLRMAAADAGRALWADAIVAGGMNAGLAGFAVGLIADEAAIKNAFTPLLGLSILVGLSAAVVRLDVRALFRPSPPPSPPVTAAAA